MVVADGIEPSFNDYQSFVLAVVLCHNYLAARRGVEPLDLWFGAI